MALNAYSATTWQTGDVVTATKMNNIENQISALTKIFITTNNTDRYLSAKGTYGIISIADNNNFSISNGILNLIDSPTFSALTVTNNVSANGFSGGSMSLSGTLSVTDKLTVTSTNINLLRAVTMADTLSVTGNTTLGGTLNVTGATTLGGNLTVNGISSFSNITGAKFTLASDLTEFANRDLISYSCMTNYVGEAVRSITQNVATTSNNGLMSSADKLKLDNIAANATANAGTITEITMNGTSKGTAGVVDLGIVITDVSDKADAASPEFTGTITLGSTTITEQQLQDLLTLLNN